MSSPLIFHTIKTKKGVNKMEYVIESLIKDRYTTIDNIIYQTNKENGNFNRLNILVTVTVYDRLTEEALSQYTIDRIIP